MIKPLMFGYLRAAFDAPTPVAPDVGVVRTAMLRFATREGFSLAQVFVETRTHPPYVALDSLLEATRFTRIAAVLVFDRHHLGADTRFQDTTRDLIQRTAECPVIAMRLTSIPGQRDEKPQEGPGWSVG